MASPSAPILVSGVPRSGSTWVGRILSLAPGVRYVHEPFNLSAPDCSCGLRIEHWFAYVTKENEDAYRRHMAHTFGSPLGPFNRRNALSRSRRSAPRLLKYGRRCVESAWRRRVLAKAPLAVLSAEWLASTFGMQVILVVRHPAAVAASFKRLSWGHPFSHFLEQPALMRDHLGAYEAEIREQVRADHDLVVQAALLWKLIYSVVAKFREEHPSWIIVRHEDLCEEPTGGFRDLYDAVGLRFTASSRRAVERSASSAGEQRGENPYSIARESHDSAVRWKRELSRDEIGRVRKVAGSVASLFYTDDEWS